MSTGGRGSRGGIYLIRCDKPRAILGLPLIGRHNAYTGMTNSYYHRERQHLFGSSVYGHAPKAFSDLRPKFHRIIPLPEWVTNEKILGRRLMKLIETFAIWVTLPVYNVTQQAPWNLRKITPRRADAQRIGRVKHGVAYKLVGTFGRMALLLVLAYAAYVLTTRG